MGQVRAYFFVTSGEVGLFKWGRPTHSDSMENCYGMSGQAYYDPFVFLDLPRKLKCISAASIEDQRELYFLYSFGQLSGSSRSTTTSPLSFFICSFGL